MLYQTFFSMSWQSLQSLTLKKGIKSGCGLPISLIEDIDTDTHFTDEESAHAHARD